MANYEHLPIFKSIYDLLIESYRITKDFQKEYKYTIGEKIKTETLELIILVYDTNSKYDKLERKNRIEQAVKFGEEVKLLWRICSDLKIINVKKFVEVSAKVVEVLKQLEGWKRSME